MAKQSAGILLYRKSQELEVLLVHPGGPFFARKDLGSWSVPKGEYLNDEDPLDAAKREFEEETGQKIDGDFISLLPIKQSSGKIVTAWAVEGELDVETVVSNNFEMIWPPGSDKLRSFPEIDKAAWFSLETAKQKINKGQIPLLDQLADIVKV